MCRVVRMGIDDHATTVMAMKRMQSERVDDWDGNICNTTPMLLFWI